MLAFEYPGGWNDVKGSTAVTVLQFLMGGGGSFSAGGPGGSWAGLCKNTCLAFWQSSVAVMRSTLGVATRVHLCIFCGSWKSS